MFFIWAGIALLVDFGWGIGLLGVGIITLGIQALRKFARLGIEWFWVTIGILFLTGGIWQLAAGGLPLPPVLLIVVGVALLLSILRRK